MKNYALFLCMLLMGLLHAQFYTVKIPLNQLVEEETSYCFLSDEEGRIIDDFFHNPFLGISPDTIRLFTKEEAVYHLTVVTDYLSENVQQRSFTKALTYYGLEEDFYYQSLVVKDPVAFSMSPQTIGYPRYSFSQLEHSVSNILLPPAAELLENQFRLRQQRAEIEIEDQRDDAYYIFFRQSAKQPWRYYLNRPDNSGGNLVYDDLPQITKEKEIILPIFEDWEIQLSAYHPYYDGRIGIPFSESRAGVFKGRNLFLNIPEDDILEDFLLRAEMNRIDEIYLYVYRGNELPTEVTRIEPYYSVYTDFATVSVKVGGPNGYFLLSSPRSYQINLQQNANTYQSSNIEWTMMGAIPSTGHINFVVPLYTEEMVERIPNLRRFTSRQFNTCKLIYPKINLSTAEWSLLLPNGSELLNDFGGTMITKSLRAGTR